MCTKYSLGGRGQQSVSDKSHSHLAPTALLLPAALPLGARSISGSTPLSHLSPQPQLSRHLGLNAGSPSFARLAERWTEN